MEMVGLYCDIGDRDRAMSALERAHAERASTLIWLKLEPRYDPIRGEPRFQEILRELNLNS
jgi:hypothetical protein